MHTKKRKKCATNGVLLYLVTVALTPLTYKLVFIWHAPVLLCKYIYYAACPCLTRKLDSDSTGALHILLFDVVLEIIEIPC